MRFSRKYLILLKVWQATWRYKCQIPSSAHSRCKGSSLPLLGRFQAEVLEEIGNNFFTQVPQN